jgi:hypothetical protein
MSSPAQTWAKVVEQSSTAPTDKKLFAQSVCTVSLANYLPKIKTPSPSGKFPVFFDLTSTQASHDEIANALPPGILGVHWRADMNILEVDVQTKEEQSNLLSQPLQLANHLALTPLPSTADSPRYILVKLANVPIASAVTLETVLRRHWEQYGKVKEIAPHRIPGKAWLTRRWDLIIEVDPKSSPPPTIFEVLETKVLAWWPRAPKTCLTCKIVGHNSSSCPRKKPKATGNTNPPKPPTTPAAHPLAAPVSDEAKKGNKRRQRKKTPHQSEKSEEVGDASAEMQGVVTQSDPLPSGSGTHTPPNPTPIPLSTSTPTITSPFASTQPFAGSIARTEGGSTVYSSALSFGPPPAAMVEEDELEYDEHGQPIISSPMELQQFLRRSGSPSPAPRFSSTTHHTPPSPSARGNKKKKKQNQK